MEDRKVGLEGAGEKRIRHQGACQLQAAASCLLLWAERNLAVPSWKVLRRGAAATVPAQTEEEVGSRGRGGHRALAQEEQTPPGGLAPGQPTATAGIQTGKN